MKILRAMALERQVWGAREGSFVVSLINTGSQISMEIRYPPGEHNQSIETYPMRG